MQTSAKEARFHLSSAANFLQKYKKMLVIDASQHIFV